MNASLVGVNIQDYVVVKQLAEGGMGVVYEAHHVCLKKRRVVKVLHPNCSSQGYLHDRFVREAQITAELGQHPNIVRVEGLGQLESGQRWIMYEFLEGETLEARLACGPLHEQVALIVFLQMCEALHYAHGRNVIHRDIKPENIFLCDRSLVKVIDFGIAKGPTEDGIHTQNGSVFGTRAYMAPEQMIDTAAVDQRADVYALAGTVTRMLTGRLPCDGGVSLLPSAWSAPIRAALELDPARRTQTVCELGRQVAANIPDAPGFLRRHAPGLLRDSGSGRLACELETLVPEPPGGTVPLPPPSSPGVTTMRLGTGVMAPLPAVAKPWWRTVGIATVIALLAVGMMITIARLTIVAPQPPQVQAPTLPADAGIDAVQPDAAPELPPDAATPRLPARPPSRRAPPRLAAPVLPAAEEDNFDPDSPTGTPTGK